MTNQTPDASRPNVVFIFSDEHRWHSMSFTEMPELQTPNMERLARQGMSFDNCISNYPVCSPQRAILMTGRWPYQQKMLDGAPGMIDNALNLSPDQPTLGKAFKDAGYETGYIGKWHLGGGRAEAFGFDHSLIWSGTNNHWKSTFHPAEGAPVETDMYNATGMTDQALEFIEAKRERPFFLMLSWNPPHSRFTDPPEEKKALYPTEDSLSLRPNHASAVALDKSREFFDEQSEWPVYQGYHAHVSAIDDELGRVMERLDELGLADDTIVIYTSDHGSMLGSHGHGGKRQPYQESIRTPFILRWPGKVPAGATADALFGSIDIMPSLCALAGVPAPECSVGEDFSPTMLGDDGGPQPDSQFLMHISKAHAARGKNHPAPLFRGVVTGRHTYAVYPDGPSRLFDHESDPYQQDNRIDDPVMADVRRELHAMLAEWIERSDDPFEIPADS